MFEENSSETVWVMQMYIKQDVPTITFKCWCKGVNADNGQTENLHRHNGQ